MNTKEAQLVEDYERIASDVAKFSTEIDAQIKYLQALRESFRSLTVMFEPLVARMRAGTSHFLEDPNSAAEKFEHLADVAKEKTPLFAQVTSAPRAATTAQSEPMWKIIERTMRGRDKFTMTEAGETLERELGRPIGKNRPQTVRNNLIRHAETFRQNMDGTWSVVTNERSLED